MEQPIRTILQSLLITVLVLNAIGPSAAAAQAATTNTLVEKTAAQPPVTSAAPASPMPRELVGKPAAASKAGHFVPASTNSLHSLPTSITTITRVSVDSSGAQGNANSNASSISADGRYVAFHSYANNLVNGDTNNDNDIFLRDTQTGITTRISVDSNGAQANGGSSSPSISADGRYVAFESYASNLISGDTNGFTDIFVHDTQTGTTTRLSLDSSGTQENSGAHFPSISADGRYVAFYADASNLVSGDTNGYPDVFVRDIQTNTTTRISVDSSETQGDGASFFPSTSANGRYIAFLSNASNLVNGDTNGCTDVFVRDIQTNTTTRISVDSDGAQGNNYSSYPASISADGHYVAFSSIASNLVSNDTNPVSDIFLRDTQTGVTTFVSLDSSGAQGNSPSDTIPSISADGRYVAFTSFASNLVNGDTNAEYDIFLRDMQTGTTKRLSLDSSGIQGNSMSYSPVISADGRYVAFESIANNLVSGDTNGAFDIFVLPVPSSSVFRLFLPIISKPAPPPAPRGIYGTVTENGTPVAGVSLDLRFNDGVSWSTFTNVTTASDGSYSFTGIPSLSAGQFYYVLYQNTSGGNPNRIWTWHTQSLSAFTAGGEAHIGDFDLANITLVSPSNGAIVSLPHTFQWTPRSATPSDTYEFDLYDFANGDPYFYTVPPLGYVGAYTLNGVPTGFSPGVQYVWEIWVYSPDGGYGISYETYDVMFSNTGLGILAQQSAFPKHIQRMDDLLQK